MPSSCANLQSVHGFRCYDNSPNAKWQRALALCLVYAINQWRTQNFALRGQQVDEARRAEVAGPKVEAEIRGRAGLEEGG